MKKRLKALEAKVAQEGFGPDRRPAGRLGEAQTDKEAHGEFESECPGYCGAGHVLRRHPEGGRTHLQQTFIDTYSKVALAKLSDRKTPLAAADLLNDRVVPFLMLMK